MAMQIGILKKGDQVLNVWAPSSSTMKIAVKSNKNDEVYIYSVTIDDQNLPRVDQKDTLIITHGNGEIKTEIPVQSKNGGENKAAGEGNSKVECQTF